jgi:hypothetical protein
MEILKRVKPENIRFRVLRPFMRYGKRVEPGEEVEISVDEQTNFVANGRVIPLDLKPVDVYICIQSFSLPGNVEKFEAKAGELVSLIAEDALRLMLSRNVIPKDESRWRPFNRRLAKVTDLTPR